MSARRTWRSRESSGLSSGGVSDGLGALDPPAVPEVVTAARAFRAAGYFALSGELSDEDFARALVRTWEEYEGEDLTEETDEIDWKLVVLDADRTVYDDTEADVGAGNNVYVSYLRRLSKCSGGAFKITNVKEDWKTQPGSVIVSLRLNDERRHLRLADCNDWIDPDVITGLNELLPSDGPRFFIVDTGGQSAIVTRATEAERQALDASTNARLLSEPPEWWLSVHGVEHGS